MAELSTSAESEPGMVPKPGVPTRRKHSKKRLEKPPYVGIYIQCHGGFNADDNPNIICPPPGVTLKKQSRGGYGCLTYGVEHNNPDDYGSVIALGIAIELAYDTYKMEEHSVYEKRKMDFFKGTQDVDRHMEHFCVPGETCISSPAESSEPCWRVTNYSPCRRDEPQYLRSAFQIYVDGTRYIDLWNCTVDDFILFMRIKSNDEVGLRIQTDVLKAIRNGHITTVDLFNIIHILQLQGYSNFNIADHACHVVSMKEEEYMRPSEVTRGETSKSLWKYGGRKRKTKKRRRYLSSGFSFIAS